MNSAEIKKENLIKLFKTYEKVVLAFSGGVDSTFMLKTAKDTLGDKAVAVTLKAPVFPTGESKFAEEFCRKEGIRYYAMEVDLLGNEEFTANDKERCYTCKKLLFEEIMKLACEIGMTNICEGSIADDENDYRPGKKAIDELGIISPMKEVGLTKEEIRYLSKKMNLPTWNKPSMACLASRFPYGKKINSKQLKMIEASEKYLMELGFLQVRVRIHDDVARIEVDSGDFEKITAPHMRDRICFKLSDFGFSYVALDLQGYRTGSMNETIL